MAAAELIQDLETTVGAFFLTYFSAGLFALWIPVVFCRAATARSCAIAGSRQRYELLPQGEDGAEAAEEAGGEGGNDSSGGEEDAQPGGSIWGALALAAGPAGCAQMLSLGLLFGPLWFFANWTYNASLQLTSVRRTGCQLPDCDHLLLPNRSRPCMCACTRLTACAHGTRTRHRWHQ